MTLKYLPIHATLVHPLTGAPVQAIGHRKDGTPIWPAMGGSQPEGEPANPVPPAPVPSPVVPTPVPTPAASGPKHADPSEPTDSVGDAGKRAIAAERAAAKVADEARKATEKVNADLKAQLDALAPLQKLAAALGASDTSTGKTDVELIGERLAAQEAALADQKAATETERLLRIRLEVAQDKGLTKAQAARLRGTNLEELTSDADELLALFPPPAAATEAPKPVTPAKPTPPKPDPSQGARGEGRTRNPSLGGSIAAAMAPPTT